MANTENGAVKPLPPYMSYGVLTKSIETLKERTVPSGAMDRRVLNEFSGADYGSLISGLRFLGLIDEQRKATSKYRELVAAWGAPKFKELLHETLLEKYKPVISGLNLQAGTAAELEKAFKDYGVSPGQMLTKSIRFFLKAMGEAGEKLSPHMTAPKLRILKPARKSMSSSGAMAGAPIQEQTTEKTQEIPQGFERLPLPGMPNSYIQYPSNLTEIHCQLFEAMVGMLRTYVKGRNGSKETP